MKRKDVEKESNSGWFCATLAVFLISAWPFAHVVSVNIDQKIDVFPALVYSLLLFFAFTFTYFVLRRAIGTTLESGVLVILILTVWFFSFDGFVRICQDVLGIPFNRTNILILWISVIVLVLLASRNFAKSTKTIGFCLLTSAGIVSAPLATIIGSYLLTTNKEKAAIRHQLPSDLLRFESDKPLEKLNVYYFLIDAYPRHDVLSDLMSFFQRNNVVLFQEQGVPGTGFRRFKLPSDAAITVGDFQHGICPRQTIGSQGTESDGKLV